jgi:anhydro-N-acetylmuramic acid kinase
MYIVGLISGTSADGIDAALCEISGAPPALSARIIAGLTHPFPDGMQARIQDAGTAERGRTDDLAALHFELGEMFAQAALKVIEQGGMQPGEVDLIGSHGQNFWHNVTFKGDVTATLQLTEASIIAERTGITTLCNFRPRDVAAGGQGAPLTAYIDWLLLRHPEHWRAVQNIGGIANVTFLPPLSDTESLPLAFDTGPGNALIDSAVRILSDGKRSYDRHGLLARAGKPDVQWVKIRLSHPYITRKPPKSTGREVFGADMAEKLVKSARQRGMNVQDTVASLTYFTTESIAISYKRFAPQPVQEVILGGGGRHNPAIVAGLRESLAPAAILSHEDVGIDSDRKEALVFAVLAHETWHNRPGNLPSLTGAKHPVVLGQITPGANYEALIRRTWCGGDGA